MTANIFISHTREEKQVANELKAAICADFHGVPKVFASFDLVSIQAGETWLAAVEEGLGRATLLLVLCSRRSVLRPWINFEAGAAWLRKIPIVPVCHSGLPMAELPLPLAVLQGIVLTDPDGLEQLYRRIASQTGFEQLPRSDFVGLATKLSVTQLMSLPPAPEETRKALDPSELLNDISLQRAIDHAHLGWTLCFIGEDQSDKLAQLTDDLEADPSEDGHGKCFDSGFAYWGIGPTLAWARACTDPAYIVAKKGIEAFPAHWKKCATKLDKIRHHVSLGIGTGQKDRVIMRTLLDHDPNALFVPVDMSGEMLRVGISECRKNEDLRRSRILPVQIDFSMRENAASIFGVVNSVAPAEPVLYSLLGNTLANFEDDTELLTIVASMLRFGDKLLLELASTLVIDDHRAARACAEYKKSESFFAFSTSALDYHTSMHVDRACVEFLPKVAADSAVEVRTVYRNRSGTVMPLKITTGRKVVLQPNETIRLYLTRKYLASRVEAMLSQAGLHVEETSKSVPNADGFGSIVVLASPRQ